MLSGFFVLEWLIVGELVGDGFEFMGPVGKFMALAEVVMALSRVNASGG